MTNFVSLSRTAFVTGVASDLHLLGSSCSDMRKVLSRVKGKGHWGLTLSHKTLHGKSFYLHNLWRLLSLSYIQGNWVTKKQKPQRMWEQTRSLNSGLTFSVERILVPWGRCPNSWGCVVTKLCWAHRLADVWNPLAPCSCCSKTGFHHLFCLSHWPRWNLVCEAAVPRLDPAGYPWSSSW